MDLQHCWGLPLCALSHLDLMKLDPSALPIFMSWKDDAFMIRIFLVVLWLTLIFPERCHGNAALSILKRNLASGGNPEGVSRITLLASVLRRDHRLT